MLVGDANQREKIGDGMKSQTCFRCFNGPDFAGDNAAPCADATLDTEGLPTGKCHGIRSNVLYPTYVPYIDGLGISLPSLWSGDLTMSCSCWDGQNLDSPDHKSHVAYPVTGPQTFTGTSVGGDCPSTHPVKIPQLMLEVRAFYFDPFLLHSPVQYSSPLISFYAPSPPPSTKTDPFQPHRSSGTQDPSTTSSGPPTARSPSSSQQATRPATASTAITSLAGRAILSREPWTADAWAPAVPT